MSRIYFSLLTLCAALLFLAGLGNRHLTGSDEPRVAGISAAMAAASDPVVPRLNAEPFLEKPPLYFWISAAVFQLLGKSTFTARLPSAVAAICGVLLVFLLARGMGFSAFTALLCACILATSIEYWTIGRKCIIDMLLCLFTTGAMLSFYQALRCSTAKALWAAGFVLFLGCAVMTKGLVGLAVPLAALFVWLLAEKNLSMRAWFLLGSGALLCLIPTAIWTWLLYRSLGWHAVYEVVWTNSFGRFSGMHAAHIKPFYYYLINFPGQFVPWIIFLPPAVIYHVKQWQRPKPQSPALFFATWFVVPFLLLSISAAKRDLYLLPVYPAAAFFVGTGLGGLLETEPRLTKWLDVASSLLAGVIMLASAGLLGIAIYLKSSILICFVLAFATLALGLWAYRRLRQKDLAKFFKIVMVALVGIFLLYDYSTAAFSNRRGSYEPLFNYCAKLESKGVRIRLFEPAERIRGAAVFYLGRVLPVIRSNQALQAFLSSTAPAVAIARKRRVPKLKDIVVLKTFTIGRRKVAIIKATDDGRFKIYPSSPRTPGGKARLGYHFVKLAGIPELSTG